MADAVPITLASLLERTTSGVGTIVDMGPRTTARLDLDVTAVAGSTPSLAVTLETSRNAVAWRLLGGFPTFSAVSTIRKVVPGVDRYLRASWVITGGSPSFAFSLGGHAVLVYATPDDLGRLSMGASALATVSLEDKAKALEAATDLASGYLGRFGLPLSAWGDDLRRAVTAIAVYDMMSEIGFNPDGTDSNFRKRYEDAIRWLEKVAAGQVTPLGVIDSTPTTYESGPDVYSEELRGW